MNIKLIHTYINTKIILQKIKVAVIYLFLVEVITVNDTINMFFQIFLYAAGSANNKPKKTLLVQTLSPYTMLPVFLK